MGGDGMKPLCIDLFCGLGGWAEGFLSEGFDVIGFDIERHDYGTGGYPGQLVLQDALTLHGRQFRNAACIVASPPCQEYSYMAMPWALAKAKAAAIRADETGGARRKLTALFDACFRIQREASEAAGRHIPMVVENVRGAQPWVGRAPWNYGSFYLWGDVPALMPFTFRAQKIDTYSDPRRNGGKGSHLTCQSENLKRLEDGMKADTAHAWFNDHKRNGVEIESGSRLSYTSSGSSARKAASAQIAKIPFDLAVHIARCFKPSKEAAA